MYVYLIFVSQSVNTKMSMCIFALLVCFFFSYFLVFFLAWWICHNLKAAQTQTKSNAASFVVVHTRRRTAGASEELQLSPLFLTAWGKPGNFLDKKGLSRQKLLSPTTDMPYDLAHTCCMANLWFWVSLHVKPCHLFQPGWWGYISCSWTLCVMLSILRTNLF